MATEEPDILDPKKAAAIVALLNHPTVKVAAESIGMGERTLHRWLVEDRVFIGEYRKARRAAYAHAISITQHYTPLAVKTLATVMSDPRAPHTAKVSASQALLKFGRESIELDELVERVAALEHARREDTE